MGWSNSLDLYCERMGPGFWAEPLNALSNLAFIAVGIWVWRRSRAETSDKAIQIICFWPVAIGFCSFVFHTFANRWAEQIDAIPIQLFILGYTFFSLVRFAELALGAAIVWFAAIFLSLPYFLTKLPVSWFEATNGSLYYFPAFFILFGFGIVLSLQAKPVGRSLIISGFIFLISLTFRAIDHDVCNVFPTGTHFFWHIFNAILLGILGAATIRYGQRKPVG